MIDPAKHIRVVNNLNFDESPELKVIEIVDQAGKRIILSCKDPRGMAPSILYLVSHAEVRKASKTQAEIAKAAGVTEVTIRNRSKELRKRRHRS